MTKTVFISADHGLAIVYFLQSDIIPALLEAGNEVVLLTDDSLKEKIEEKFGRPGLHVEGLRLKQANDYFSTVNATEQWWLNFLRRVGGSSRINPEAMDSHVQQVDYEAQGKRKLMMPIMKWLVKVLRSSAPARKMLIKRQMKYTPDLYGDLFHRYQPSLVIASTPGWRLDRYLMRQAVSRGIPTMGAIVGWDNPSSYAIPGAPVDWATCWSENQKEELILGSDWQEDAVHIGGIPSYDGYFRKTWLMEKHDYYDLHHLDPNRKLLSYACSFITFSPNYQNIEAIAELVASDEFVHPSQLLIRLHPNHFMDEPLFAEEKAKIEALAERLPHVHVVEPVALGGELGRYSGEDMPEKCSMMAHADVFLTVYSTMVVEAAIHDRPIVSVCIDAPGGWNQPGRFSLALSKIGDWPTHQRFIKAGAGIATFDKESLKHAINTYLENPDRHSIERQQFIRQECTFTDGSSGKRTADFIISCLDRKPSSKRQSAK